MYSDLSQKQLEILMYIKNSLQNKGYPPSVREICPAVDLKSTSTVHAHLSKLEAKGYIRRDPTKPRTIEVLDTFGDGISMKKEVIQVPVVGNVTAGQPILAVENIEEFIPIPAQLFGKDGNFILKVQGDSMMNAGILNGDFIIVEPRNIANNGDIVVALVGEDESTVKRFYKEENRIRLEAENPAYSPIYGTDIQVIGLVKGVMRVIN